MICCSPLKLTADDWKDPDSDPLLVLSSQNIDEVKSVSGYFIISMLQISFDITLRAIYPKDVPLIRHPVNVDDS